MKKKYNGWKWISVKRRFQIYLRDQHTCQYCSVHRDEYGVIMSLDHISSQLVYKKRWGWIKDHSNENLVTCCLDCNIRKDEASVQDFTPRAGEILAQAKKPLPDSVISLSYRYTKQQPLF